jgi:hypothetical protein
VEEGGGRRVDAGRVLIFDCYGVGTGKRESVSGY